VKSILCTLSVLSILVTGCSKDGDTPSGGTSYYESNGKCYDKLNNNVEESKCENLEYVFSSNSCFETKNRRSTEIDNCTKLVGRYFYLNGVCRDKENDLESVSNKKCLETRTTVDCDDKTYYYFAVGMQFNVDCRRTNCSGRELLDRETNTFVICK
jgi:hypothetical protein